MRTKPAENIRSFVDLSHIDRMSAPPQPKQTDLPFPEAPADDVIEGPRIPARYGSYATEIWVSKRLWRRTDGLPEARFHYQNRWHSITDYTDEDCVVGKRVSVNNAWIAPYIGLAGLTEDGHLSIDGHETLLTARHVTVLEDDVHLNPFERAILDRKDP